MAGASSAHRRASPFIGSDLYNVREDLERGTGGSCRGLLISPKPCSRFLVLFPLLHLSSAELLGF